MFCLQYIYRYCPFCEYADWSEGRFKDITAHWKFHRQNCVWHQ